MQLFWVVAAMETKAFSTSTSSEKVANQKMKVMRNIDFLKKLAFSKK